MISVIIPCRNGRNYLPAAIESVKKQGVLCEIVVVDDGSTDDTGAVASGLGARVFSIPHSGLSAARNVALKNITGDYVLFLDHDDLMTEGALARLLEALRTNPDVDYVQAKLQDFISPELSEDEKRCLAPRKEPYGGLLTGAFLFRRKVIDVVGGFDENLKTGQGVDFLLRCDKAGMKTMKLDFVATMRRFHNNNMGRTMQQQENKDYASILRAKLLAARMKK